jgi:DNA polymerase-3 subunit gamma/tau
MNTLYRKYRPKNFEEVVGQNHVKITLINEIQTDKIAHSYLFCGPRAVGKTTLARVFSKAINCLDMEKGKADPCSKCEICEEISTGRSFDIIEIDAASHTGVDNVRENIINSARLAPSKCKYKVFIIDEVHMLSISAFNALLKILEEPPANVIFILCTTEVHKIPDTIISRCQRFDFRRIGVSDVVKKLSYIVKKENIEIDREILEEIARRSEGYMRDAESLLGQIVAIGGKKISKEEADLVLPRSDMEEIIKLINFLSTKNASKSVELINNLVDNGVDIKVFLKDLVEVLRRMMLNKLNPELSARMGIGYGESIELKISEAGSGLKIEDIVLFIEKFSEAANKIKSSFIIQLPVEIAILEISQYRNKDENVIKNNSSKEKDNKVYKKETDDNFSAVNDDSGVEYLSGKWAEVLIAIKKYNHSLSFILRACVPKEIKDNKLTVVFKYKFHKDRINDMEIRPIVEKVLEEVYGKKIEINPIVDENLLINNNNKEEEINKPEQVGSTENENVAENENNNNNSDKNEKIDNILKTFGGRVVK